MSGDDDLNDLIGFLADRRLQVRLMALEIIKGLTATPEGIDKLKSQLDKLLVFMLRLVPVPDPQPQAIQVSEAALVCLVNLAQDMGAAGKMLGAKVVGRLMDYIREGACPHHRLMAMLLCNLTVLDDGCKELLQLGQERLEGLNMAILLKKFVMSGVNWQEGQEDPYEHVAAILTNVTRLPSARKLLLQPGRGLLQLLVAQLRCPSEMRKRGSAGAIKNCCMEAEKDQTLETITADGIVLTRLLSCLDGQEPKEKDDTVREAVAESLLALASTKEGRDALSKVKAQEALRKGYEYEEHPGVCRAMEHIAELFMVHGDVFQTEEQEKAGDGHKDTPQAQAEKGEGQEDGTMQGREQQEGAAAAQPA